HSDKKERHFVSDRAARARIKDSGRIFEPTQAGRAPYPLHLCPGLPSSLPWRASRRQFAPWKPCRRQYRVAAGTNEVGTCTLPPRSTGCCGGAARESRATALGIGHWGWNALKPPKVSARITPTWNKLPRPQSQKMEGFDVDQGSVWP